MVPPRPTGGRPRYPSQPFKLAFITSPIKMLPAHPRATRMPGGKSRSRRKTLETATHDLWLIVIGIIIIINIYINNIIIIIIIIIIISSSSSSSSSSSIVCLIIIIDIMSCMCLSYRKC